MSAKVKYHIIYRHRTEYPVAGMCKFFGVSRSGCCVLSIASGRPEQTQALAEVIAKQRERSFRMNRDFHASKPNSKWVTDISYIHTRQGVLYLSMIRDLYDNSIVACKTGTEQTVNLVLDTIRLAMKQEKEKVAVELQLHSDQGAESSQVYFKLTQTYGITPSMSRRGTPMTMQWRKISSLSSKQNVFTVTSRLSFRRPIS